MVEMKTCPRCKQLLPKTADYFHRVTRRGGGFVSRCKACLKTPLRPLPKEKACTSCKKTLPATDEFFHVRKRVKQDSWHSRCKVCMMEHDKIYKSRADKEKRNAVARAYVAKNLEQRRLSCRKSYARHREQRVADAAKYRAIRLNVEGNWTGHDLLRLFKQQNGRCFYCQVKVGWHKDAQSWAVDHFIPLARGGNNHPENLRIACRNCNAKKWAKLPWEFMPDRFSPPESQAAD